MGRASAQFVEFITLDLKHMTYFCPQQATERTFPLLCWAPPGNANPARTQHPPCYNPDADYWFSFQVRHTPVDLAVELSHIGYCAFCCSPVQFGRRVWVSTIVDSKSHAPIGWDHFTVRVEYDAERFDQRIRSAMKGKADGEGEEDGGA